jgi:hypothetical protein
MKTKTFLLTTLVFVFLLIVTTGINAQTVKSKLDQVKLMPQRVGIWETSVDKDTVLVRDHQEYGKSYTGNVYFNIKGNKTPYYMSSSTFDSKDGKFKGFTLYANGNYSTWIGSWTTEKKFSIDIVQNFKPEAVLSKVEYVYDSPTSMIETRFTAAGVKTLERKYKKVK